MFVINIENFKALKYIFLKKHEILMLSVIMNIKRFLKKKNQLEY